MENVVYKKSEKVNRALKHTMYEFFQSGQMQLPTEKDLCRKLGVSRGTVQKAMNELVESGFVRRIAGKGTFINEQFAKAYQALDVTNTVVLSYDVLQLSEFRSKVVRGVAKAAHQKGFAVVITSFQEGIAMIAEKSSVQKSQIGMVSCNFLPEEIQIIKDFPRAIPYVAMNDGRYQFIADYCVLGSESYEPGLMHLTELGHKRICILEESLNKINLTIIRRIVERLRCSGHDLTISSKECFYDKGRVEFEICDVLAMPQIQRPTAIICADDIIASWVIKSLAKRGVRVPEDMSVIGIGDFDISSYYNPAISTIALDYDAMGVRAMEVLGQQFNGVEVSSPKNFINYRFIKRESTCPPL